MKHYKDIEHEQKYGRMTEKEIRERVRGSIGGKLADLRARQAEEEQAKRDRYSLTYPQIVKAIPQALKKINSLREQPEALRKAKREELSKEFDKLLKIEAVDPNTNKELWINERVVKYMATEEYIAVKEELAQATNDYSIYLALKDEWEKENADIIEAERIRSKRAELLGADPEALKALGITPDPTFMRSVAPQAVGAKAEDIETLNALRAMHPSATEAELEGMLKSM